MKMKRAVDVARETPAGDLIAKLGTAEYGIDKCETRRGFLYVHLSKDGTAKYPGNTKGVRFWLPGDIPVDVGEIIAREGEPTEVILGDASGSTLVTIRVTVQQALVIRSALAGLQASTEGMDAAETTTEAVQTVAALVPASEVKQ